MYYRSGDKEEYRFNKYRTLASLFLKLSKEIISPFKAESRLWKKHSKAKEKKIKNTENVSKNAKILHERMKIIIYAFKKDIFYYPFNPN